MLKIYISLIVIMGCIHFNTAQKNINDYKYLILPLKFDFLNADDKYRLNTLTRHLFKSEGFTTYFDKEDVPEDLFSNRCLAMYGDVIKEKGFLITKVGIELRDCKGELILKSETGRSKTKEYEKAYSQAITEAFESMKPFNYSYTPKISNKTVPRTTSENDQTELERLRQEIATLKTKTEAQTMPVTPSIPVAKTPPTPVSVEVNNAVSDKNNTAVYSFAGQRFELKMRQAGGYDLLNSKNTTVYKLMPTSQQKVYIAVGNFKQGVAILNAQQLSIEFYDTSNTLITETYAKH